MRAAHQRQSTPRRVATTPTACAGTIFAIDAAKAAAKTISIECGTHIEAYICEVGLGTQHKGPFDSDEAPPCSNFSAPWSKGAAGVPCSCGSAGCLFDLVKDPSETTNLAAAMPDVVERLRSRIDELRAGVYAPERGEVEQAACDQIASNGGYWGPWLQ